MKFLILCSVIIALSYCIWAHELNVHISSKSKDDLAEFIHRLFPVRNIEIKEEEDTDTKVDIQIELKDGSISCDLCEAIIKELFKLIKFRTYDEIKKALGKVCKFIPKVFRKKCSKFVMKYGDKITKMIMRNLSKKVICKMIKQCVTDSEEGPQDDSAAPQMLLTKSSPL